MKNKHASALSKNAATSCQRKKYVHAVVNGLALKKLSSRVTTVGWPTTLTCYRPMSAALACLRENQSPPLTLGLHGHIQKRLSCTLAGRCACMTVYVDTCVHFLRVRYVFCCKSHASAEAQSNVVRAICLSKVNPHTVYK
jgi:hypothetical protein